MNLIKICACGCGKPIIYKEYHKKYPVKFISGHNTRIRTSKQLQQQGLKIKENWIIRKANGWISPAKGKKKGSFTEEHCRNIGLSKKGITLEMRYGKEKADEMKKQKSKCMLGDLNPAKKPEAKKKISDKLLKMYQDGTAKCGFKKGEHHSEKHCKNISIGVEKAYQEGRLNNSLENHPNWQDGKSKEEYGFDFTNELKEWIKKRDNFECQMCSECTIRLLIHHIDYNKKNNDEENLITLCEVCHGKTNYKRETWKEFFKNKNRLLINKRGDDAIGTNNQKKL